MSDLHYATFVDRSGERKIVFDSTVKTINPPTIRRAKGFSARWEPFVLEDRDITVRAIYEPIKISFIDGEKTVTQYYREMNPPKLENVPGYIREWVIPEEGYGDITVFPTEREIHYRITCIYDENKTRTYAFSANMRPRIAPMPVKEGHVGYWDGLDFDKYESQIVFAKYRPMVVKAHMPDGKIIECVYDPEKGFELPELEGAEWPIILSEGRDLDIYPREDVKFALFYVDRKLRFCVPFTEKDKRYLDEMLTLRTVPKLRGEYGEWKEHSPKDGFLRYAAEYGYGPVGPRENTSINWELSQTPKYLCEYGSFVKLGGSEVDLFTTEYTKITGIGKNNVYSLKPCMLMEWLEREGIPCENRFREFRIYSDSRGPKLCVAGGQRGTVAIGFHEKFADAIEFLAMNDIEFIEGDEGLLVGNLPLWHLRTCVHMEDTSTESLDAASADLLPIDRLIPPMDFPRTEYYEFDEMVKITLDEEKMKQIFKRNETVVNIFDGAHCPECDFVLNEDNSVVLKNYRGSKSDFEIPEKVFLDISEKKSHIVKTIAPGAFRWCCALKSVAVPGSVEIIDDNAFENCENLSFVKLSDGLKTIGNNAFAGCFKLRTVRIPQSVEIIGDNAFPSGCEVEKPDISINESIEMCQCEELTIDSDVFDFISSLDENERKYLFAMCEGKSVEEAMEGIRRSNSLVVAGINAKAADKMDEDSGVFEDDGSVREDYIKEFLRYKVKR